jgi:tagatose 1,6-diphosphate aldolase
MAFEFCDPGILESSDFYLVLAGTTPPDPERGKVPAYAFHVRVSDRDEAVGQINLRVGTSEDIQRYAGNVGYKIDPAYRGRRMAERAVRLILPVARGHGMTELWICCRPDNTASRRTCERLGAELIGIIDVAPTSDLYARGDRQACRYLLRL